MWIIILSAGLFVLLDALLTDLQSSGPSAAQQFSSDLVGSTDNEASKHAIFS